MTIRVYHGKMDALATLERLRTQLRESGSEEGRRTAARFFAHPIEAYGVRATVLQQMARELGPRVKQWPLAERNRLCTELMKSGITEESALAVYVYFRFKRQCARCEFQLFERWIDRYVSNWAACDAVSTKLVAACVENEPGLMGEMREWTEAENLWKRRAAAVGLVVEARRGRHLPFLLDTADRLLADREEMVQKGVGWLLKETYPKHPEDTVDFLLRGKQRTTRLVLRYAAEKMTPSDKRKVLA
jgi:3-methyladenine DNA glycosylase AlkD